MNRSWALRLLNLEEGCTIEDIRRAFRKEAKKWHPDKYMHAGPEERAYAAEHMQRITAANDFLNDPSNWPDQAGEPSQYDEEESPVDNEAETKEGAARGDDFSATDESETPSRGARSLRRWLAMSSLTAVVLVLAAYSSRQGPQSSVVSPNSTFPHSEDRNSFQVPTVQPRNYVDKTPIPPDDSGAQPSSTTLSPATYLKALDQPLEDMVMVVAKYRIAVRSEPSTSGAVLYRIEAGTRFGVTGESVGEWLSVRHGETGGYLLRKQIQPEEKYGKPLRTEAEPRTEGRSPTRDTEQKTAVGYWTLGSTEEEVMRIQGVPTGVALGSWWYDTAFVKLEQGVVTGYMNSGEKLKVRIKADKSKLKTWRIGSTFEEVVAVQGTPSGYILSTAWYGTDFVRFENGTVSDYHNSSGELKVGR